MQENSATVPRRRLTRKVRLAGYCRNMANILILTRDVLLNSELRSGLERTGHQCGTVGSTPEAEQLLRHYRPDLLILDRPSPDETIAGFLRALNLSDEFHDLPIVVLGPTSRSLGFGVRADAVMPWPVPLGDLQLLVARLTRSPGLGRPPGIARRA